MGDGLGNSFRRERDVACTCVRARTRLRILSATAFFGPKRFVLVGRGREQTIERFEDAFVARLEHMRLLKIGDGLLLLARALGESGHDRKLANVLPFAEELRAIATR